MKPRSLGSQVFGLFAWLLAAFAAGALGAVASVDAASFYAQLSKPSWAPPASVFGPVWSVLYALMGVAAWLVWRSPASAPTRGALTMFVAQLAVVLCLASWCARGRGGPGSAGAYRRHARGVLAHQPPGCAAPGAIPRLGQLCFRADLGGMAEQPGSSLASAAGGERPY